MMADQITAMSATIEENAHYAVGAAYDNDRLKANLASDIVAAIGYFAFMCKINPDLVKDLIHFLLEQLGIAIDRAVDAVRLDQIGELVTRWGEGLKHGRALI